MNNTPAPHEDRRLLEIAMRAAHKSALPTSSTRTLPNAAAIDLLREQRDVFAEEYNLPDLTLSQTICLLIKRQS